MEPSCAYVGMRVIAIHLNRFPGRPKQELLILRYFPNDEGKKPVPAEGTWCTGPQQCESNLVAQVTFEKMSNHKTIGSYHIRFHDGHEQSGMFSVERRTPDPMPICE